ncbi:hypothetical protein S7711_02582 [Stachybotrys chartarum IBT 7711]|uniref:Uncharacterized protein n=1 Tax=Stachybotrys chartarum (strain CBS 109288 / IBT 7711) TaxID=1280523 RepID=A0A084B8V8_STACB|nr:hypothetical protein S7711_02582 [Stachybotrys chartarum IBT 7711]KFA56105.1 hypothetical protein S40293_00198 [Stachybotrys chartarum IBT 40293]
MSSGTSPSTARVFTQPLELPLHISQEVCHGRSYIVTGANVGLGRAAAQHLVAAGAAKVIMTARNVEAGKIALSEIETATGTSDVAELWELDLSNFDSVRQFAGKATSTLDRVDAVIHNAGLAALGDRKPEGFHQPLTVNVLGTFLLAVLLLPKMRRDAENLNILPHMTVVSSGTSFDMEPVWPAYRDDPLAKMNAEDNIGMKVYPLSKLLQVLAVRHLARLLPLSRGKVVLNVIDPGLCKTELIRGAQGPLRESILELHKKYGRTSETGSRTLLAGAVAGKESHGKYMDSCEIAEQYVGPWITPEDEQRTWESIAEVIEKVSPGCVQRALE